MNWSFGIVNNKVAEIFFERKKGKVVFLGHCYVKEADYTTKKERKWIEEDTRNVRLVFRKGKYKRV